MLRNDLALSFLKVLKPFSQIPSTSDFLSVTTDLQYQLCTLLFKNYTTTLKRLSSEVENKNYCQFLSANTVYPMYLFLEDTSFFPFLFNEMCV